jgi:arylsulfatase A-like enzyme
LWEGGIRVPLILRWPDRLRAGSTSAQVAITMDLSASILAATKVSVPSDFKGDGIDILPILRGESRNVDRQLFWRIAQPDRQQKAVRSGSWKLVVDGSGRGAAISDRLLFDLQDDPGERRDLAARHPDIIVRLTQLLADWEKEVGPIAARGR